MNEDEGVNILTLITLKSCLAHCRTVFDWFSDLFLIALACHHSCRHGLHFVHERDLVTTVYLCQKTLMIKDLVIITKYKV